jgi:hypothetical protein
MAMHCRRLFSMLSIGGARSTTRPGSLPVTWRSAMRPTLIATLAQAVLREDAEFHTYQMLEASVRQYREWGESAEGSLILIAVARYLAAHSPTKRAQLQTADVARRLNRGQSLHEATEQPG